MVLGNFILPHWKSLWIPFFQVSNFILQSTILFKEAKVLSTHPDNTGTKNSNQKTATAVLRFFISIWFYNRLR